MKLEKGFIKSISGEIGLLSVIVIDGEDVYNFLLSDPCKYVYSDDFNINIVSFLMIEDEAFLKEGLVQAYQEIPEDHPYKVMAFTNKKDQVVLKVVTCSISFVALGKHIEKKSDQ